MWSNTLDSDVVKGFVALGTELIKILDAVGPLNVAFVGLFAFLEKKYGLLGGLFKSATEDLTEATIKTEAIADSFDPTRAKKSLSGKKGARIKRINKLQAEGKTFDEINEDPKIKQWTQEIKEGEQALDGYNAKVQQADATLKQKNATTAQATAAERAKSSAEAADASATNAGTVADETSAGAQTVKTATTWKEVWAVTAKKGATFASTLETMKEVIAYKLATSAAVQKAVADKGVTTAELVQLGVTKLLSLGLKGLGMMFLDAAKKAIAFIISLGPVVWAVAGIVAAIGIAIGVFAHFHKTSAELREELSNLKTEISDIKSEIESLNGELKTTQERMAELLAKDSLTFTEQEELEALQKQNDELEREIYLLEQREKRLQEQAQDTFDDLMAKSGNINKSKDLDGDGEEEIYDKSLERKIGKLEKWTQEYEAAKQALVEAERSGDEKAIEKAEKRVEKAEKKVEKFQGQVDKELNQYLEDAEDIDYASADEQTKKYLDYIYNTEGRLNILNGEDQAKTVEIKRIFNKDDMSGASDEIESLVEELAKNPGDETIITKISEQCKLAEKDLNAVGLSVQDATDYFTKLGTNASFNTLEGKITEVSKAATNFESLLRGGLFKVDGVDTGLADLFDEEGKIIQTKLSQVFQGTSDQTRAEITRLLEGSYDMIADGLDDAEINYLMNRMGLSFSRAILEIEKTSLATKNLELFPGLEDEISGIIDTFSELTSAVGSVVDAMDTLDKARAEEAYSGSMSLETLEALMQSTDNYADLIEVDETGAIKLATNAQEILVAQKLEAIKTNAELALKDAELAYEEALHTEQTYSQTGPAQEFMRGLWNEVGGAMAFVGSLWSDLTSGNWDGAWDRAKAAQEASVTAKETEYANKAAEASIAVAEAAKKVENAEKMNKIAQGLTPENVKARYSSEEASGGADDPEEVKENALDELMEDFQRDMDYWENRIGANQARYEQLQNEIDLLEAKGQKADASYYQEQIELENERLRLLNSQKEEAQKYLTGFTNEDGEWVEALEEGSEEWWEVANTLNDIEAEFDDVTASIVDLQDAIGEIDSYKFEEFNTRLDDIISKLGTIRDLIAPDGEEDWFDEQGDWTEEGVAVLGTYIQELETYKQGLAEAEDAYADYVKEYAGNEKYYSELGIHSEQELYDKRQELIEQQYDYAQSISDTEQSVVDMYESNIDAVEEYTETLIDSYNDYIDSVKEALDAERDYTL